jgi:hypothetical protein
VVEQVCLVRATDKLYRLCGLTWIRRRFWRRSCRTKWKRSQRRSDSSTGWNHGGRLGLTRCEARICLGMRKARRCWRWPSLPALSLPTAQLISNIFHNHITSTLAQTPYLVPFCLCDGCLVCYFVQQNTMAGSMASHVNKRLLLLPAEPCSRIYAALFEDMDSIIHFRRGLKNDETPCPYAVSFSLW